MVHVVKIMSIEVKKKIYSIIFNEFPCFPNILKYICPLMSHWLTQIIQSV